MLDQKEASQILRLLCEWYPNRYPAQMTSSRAEGIIMDIMESFANYKPESVAAAYKKWHLDNENGPSIAGIKQLLTDDDLMPDDSPETFSDYFEDEDGYGYALSSKTHDYACIWKPNCSRDRRIRIKGQTYDLPKKLKSVVLKEKGLVNY